MITKLLILLIEPLLEFVLRLQLSAEGAYDSRSGFRTEYTPVAPSAAALLLF